MPNRRTTTLGELLDNYGGEIKTGPFGTKLRAAEYTPTGVPVISVGEVGYGRLRLHDKTPRVDTSVTNRMPEYLLRYGDIVFGRKGAVDRSARVQVDQDGWFLGSDGIRVRLPSTCDSAFIAYQLQVQAHRDWMIQHAAGSTMPSLNEGIIRRIPIVLPSIEEQRAITAVLVSLDDKIEQNRRTGAKLEELARAVFKGWFVDFEPVKAKAAGATAFPGMLPETFAKLPSRFVDSELGPVPEGWEVKPIGDVVTVRGGGTPSTKNESFWTDGTHCWATPKDLSSLQHPVLLSTGRRITTAGVAKISSGLLPIDTVLLSSRAPVGYLALAKVPTAVNQGFIAIECNGPLTPHYVLHWLDSSMEEIKGRASGTTFAEISKSAFRPIPAIVPTSEMTQAFDDDVKPLFDLITNLVADSMKLATMRDYLLPRLLSGHVRITP
ncbi:restriction endonuclease subunit S [Rubinisphaera brasiliensis]|uniref:Restriction modification system DNA specificity domain protein n=1 Tax=Rubinisphaera brasiliensis (strain ATCC 49424 / DSM 5305 / JCM 21570 / IAM 15109 / NBRC 103401 / IFAM 1448) TaxID=756272 RepID=F0SKL3_RUBBR|nr:restriction endonuclease subunit S [Rubinisphaera brasiliensis]ADY61994.1 restriction modification system DNA specificity domain protein [Rubinisphaera brasiliensis DSM 5305]